MHGTERSILLVDDDASFRETLCERLELRGFIVLSAGGGREALELIEQHRVDLAVVDMKMPEMDGLVTIAKLKERTPGLRTVLLTAHGNDKLRQATEAVDAGYFEKNDMGGFWDFLGSVKGDPRFIIVTPPGSGAERPAQARQAREGDHEPRIIGQTEAMQKLKSDIAKVAGLDCPVLIIGESGSGRKLAGRAIHQKSLGSAQRYLAVDCGAFSDSYLSRELFGVRGVEHSSQGLLENLEGGTILLEEVGNIPISLQERLVRVVLDKSPAPDDMRPASIDVRLMGTSSSSPEDMLERKQLFDDFLHKLNVFTLRLPALRERRDDILPLCGYSLNRYNRIFSKDVERFDQPFLDVLMGYDFPGNVRELENIVERAVVICQGRTITSDHLPERFQGAPAKPVPDSDTLPTLAEVEEQHIVKVLAATKGNRNEAARTLGISRASLWRKLKKMEGK